MHREKLERMAEILIEAYVANDFTAIAKKHGINEKTLRNWQARLDTDSEFSRIFQSKKAVVSEGWASEVPGAMRSCIGFIRRAADEGDPNDPEMLHSVAGALKMVSEVSATWKLLDARISRQAGRDGAPDGQAPSGAQAGGGSVIPIRR